MSRLFTEFQKYQILISLVVHIVMITYFVGKYQKQVELNSKMLIGLQTKQTTDCNSVNSRVDNVENRLTILESSQSEMKEDLAEIKELQEHIAHKEGRNHQSYKAASIRELIRRYAPKLIKQYETS